MNVRFVYYKNAQNESKQEFLGYASGNNCFDSLVLLLQSTYSKFWSILPDKKVDLKPLFSEEWFIKWRHILCTNL